MRVSIERIPIAFNAIEPCARISDHNLESRWWNMLENADYNFLGLGMHIGRELDVEERLIRRAKALVIAGATPDGLILPRFAYPVICQIKRAAELGKVICTEIPLQACLEANQARMSDMEYMFASEVLGSIREVVIGNDVSKIRQKAGI